MILKPCAIFSHKKHSLNFSGVKEGDYVLIDHNADCDFNTVFSKFDPIIRFNITQTIGGLMFVNFPKECVGELDGKNRWVDITDERVFKVVKSYVDTTIFWLKMKGIKWHPKVFFDGIDIAHRQNKFEIDNVDTVRYFMEMIDWFHDTWGEVVIKDNPETRDSLHPDGVISEEGFAYCELKNIKKELDIPVFVIEYYRNALHGMLGKWTCNKHKKTNINHFFTGLNRRTGVNYFNI